MDLDKPSTRRSWVYVLAAVAVALVFFLWLIPAMSRANQQPAANTEIWFHSQCANGSIAPVSYAPPNYGSREASASLCSKSAAG